MLSAFSKNIHILQAKVQYMMLLATYWAVQLRNYYGYRALGSVDVGQSGSNGRCFWGPRAAISFKGVRTVEKQAYEHKQAIKKKDEGYDVRRRSDQEDSPLSRDEPLC
jgi:hypothetical protein